MNGPVIRRAEAADAVTIAAIHREQFPRHDVSRLPQRLSSQLFANYVRDCTVVVAAGTESGEVLGYALGGRVDSLNLVRLHFALRYLALLSLSAWRIGGVRAMLRRCAALLRPTSDIAGLQDTSWQLRYIAVRGDVQRRGIASHLLTLFEASINSALRYHAWVLQDRLDVVPFYERHAFVAEASVGPHMRMVKSLIT